MRPSVTRAALVGAAGLVGLAVTAATAAPASIAITTPTAGTTVSRAATPVLLVQGTAAFGTPTPEARTFYLRGAGCGATEEFWLSTETATDEYDGCGTIGGLPFNEVLYQLGGAPSSFPARDGVPAVLDASKDVKGEIRAESWLGDGIPGAGTVDVEVTLTGMTADGDTVVLGTASPSAVNTGADGVQVPFTLPLDDALTGTALTDLTLDVEVHGANYNSSNLGLSGDSRFVLPVFDTGSVEVADTSTFSAARTVKAVVAADGTWEAELPTPAAGNRAVHARATQSGVRVTATPVAITVVP